MAAPEYCLNQKSEPNLEALSERSKKSFDACLFCSKRALLTRFLFLFLKKTHRDVISERYNGIWTTPKRARIPCPEVCCVVNKVSVLKVKNAAFFSLHTHSSPKSRSITCGKHLAFLRIDCFSLVYNGLHSGHPQSAVRCMLQNQRYSRITLFQELIILKVRCFSFSFPFLIPELFSPNLVQRAFFAQQAFNSKWVLHSSLQMMHRKMTSPEKVL